MSFKKEAREFVAEVWRETLGSILVLLVVLAFFFIRDPVKIAIVIFSTIISTIALFREDLSNEFMHYEIPNYQPLGIIAFAVVMGAFVYFNETRIVSIQAIIAGYPTIGLSAQIFLWLANAHLMSYGAHGLLLVLLWYRWKRFLPALLIALFEIALAEFFFMGSQFLQFGFILPYYWTWYIPFIIMAFPFVVLRDYFDLGDKRLWIVFVLGMLPIYATAVLNLRDPYTWDYKTNMWRSFPELIYEATAWYNMILNRIGKVLMTFAFVFAGLHVKQKAASDLLQKEP